MKIRDALPAEIDFIRDQRINAYSDHAKVIPHEHYQALIKAISTDTDVQPNVELIVAEIDGQIAGSVVLFPAKMDAYDGNLEELDYPEIRMLAVTPEARGKGVAAKLITECIDRSKAKGYNAIGLHTGEFMESALKLYTKMGFQRLPQYDFEPANDGIIVKAFRLTI